MKQISVLDRILLLITGLLAAYQISFGLNDLNTLSTWSYTVGFGVLLVAGLLLIILGFEGLENQIVVIVSTLIPLSISLGLVAEHLPQFTTPYLIFAILGFAAIAITRYTAEGKTATIILALTHGIAGSLITFLPIILSIQGKVSGGYFLVGIAGALIGVGGLLLAFLKAGKPILSQKMILTVLPALLLLMTSAFVYGFSFR
ncbi:MAG: hypothetical protein DRI65_10745 [Chloroflexota bacterium]|nr:MAG: hypothetical protein DRI65_10745 [Chloroflexota bacterium]HDD61189.1 hypothetical protein [Chloroflexota bacterium]